MYRTGLDGGRERLEGGLILGSDMQSNLVRPGSDRLLASVDSSARTANALAVIERIRSTIAHETEAFRSRRDCDLTELNYKKGQALIELNRAMRGLESGPVNPQLLASLKGLRETLHNNGEVIKRHLKAIQAISDILCEKMRDEQSDGTYSPNHHSLRMSQ